jgi:type IV secretion system protein VirB5
MKMSSLTLAVALGVAFGGGLIAPPAQATGIPVVDVANLQQQVVQYANMIKQLAELQAQLKQAEQQYAAITGGRGMGGLSRENFTQNLPTTWQETLNAMDGGGKVGQLANQIKSAASLLENGDFEGVAEDVIGNLDKSMDRAANGQALNAQVFEGSGARFQRIQSLMDQVDSAADAKAAADLNNRIAAENAMLMNEMIKLQSMNAMLASQQQVAAQQRVQEGYKMTRKKYNE